MAVRHGDPVLIGLIRWHWALQLTWMTARGRASRVLTTGIDELGQSARLRGDDTLPAETLGFLHLSSAQCAARDSRPDDARGHLDEAAAIAERIGEHNGLRMHFGPTNVAVWRLGIGVELGGCGRAGQPGAISGAAFRPCTGAGTERGTLRPRGDSAPGHRRPAGPDPDS
jgi:hypothetical protein